MKFAYNCTVHRRRGTEHFCVDSKGNAFACQMEKVEVTDLTVHVEGEWGEGGRQWEEVTLKLIPAVHGNHGSTTTWDVFRDGVYLGELIRNAGFVERVPLYKGSRIGKDLAPRTTWEYSTPSEKGRWGGGLHYDTRNQALARLLGHTSNLAVHLPGRKRRWLRCGLCEGLV